MKSCFLHFKIKYYLLFDRLYEADGTKSLQSYFLANSFNTGGFRLLNPTFLDNAIRGLIFTPVQSVDECFADDVTSQLFRYSSFLNSS